MTAKEGQFQHHVPRFYLRGWSCTVARIPKRIWLYCKGQEPKPAAIKKVGGRVNMYAVERSDGSIDLETVERYVSDVESRAGKVIPKILNQEKISSSDKEALSHFISVMYRRGPYTMDAFAPESLAPLLPGLQAEMEERVILAYRNEPKKLNNALTEVKRAIGSAEKNINSLTSLAILNSQHLGRAFGDFHWAFFFSRSSTFLTSDNPVVFNRFTGIRDPHNSAILFPISRHIVLWMSQWMFAPNTYTEIPEKLVKDINKRIMWNAFNEVYSDFSSHEIRDYVDANIGKGLPRS